jgi:hypothetical protein
MNSNMLLDAIEARGKANAQERVALIQENKDLIKLAKSKEGTKS